MRRRQQCLGAGRQGAVTTPSPLPSRQGRCSVGIVISVANRQLNSLVRAGWQDVSAIDELLPLAVGGDRQAVTGLLEALAPEVRVILGGEIEPLWRGQIDVDDLLQTTYLEAFLRIGQFASGAGAFKSWLLQIGRNNLRDAIRELSRAKRPDPRARVQGVPGDSHQQLLDLLSTSATAPDQRAVRAEMVDLLKSAIGTLPGSYQQVVEMFDIEGRPAHEIAAALRRSEGAVYMLRARAHDRLREVLGFSTG